MKKIAFLLSIFPFLLFAQSNNAPSSYDIHDIKITGYLQTQYQKAESLGIYSLSGGDFNANSDGRFFIRRGRLKIDRVDTTSNIVFQLDATQSSVQLMDAFIQLHLPKYKAILFTAGLFNRPFGYSIIYSSGFRDIPERARVFQTLMPRERDIGVMISFNSKKIKYITADIAIVNGSGISARDYDAKKDIIGSVNFKFDSLVNKKINIDFGASIYQGTVRNNTNTYYTANENGFSANINTDNINANLKRNYYGLNLQLAYLSPWGETSFKTEYVTGTQPGIAGSNSVSSILASQSFTSQPLTDLYLRNFEGYYFWLTQKILNDKINLLLAYDVYDPNTKITEKNINSTNKTSIGDIKYSTLGYGITYQINPRIKLTLYNENIHNNSTQITNYTNDLKDDVFTARLQYRW